MFWKVKMNITKGASTKYFGWSGEIFCHGVSVKFSKDNGILYGSYCCKKTKTAVMLEKQCNMVISKHVASSVIAIECIVHKVVSETTCFLKVMQESDEEMQQMVKEKYNVQSPGMKEQGIFLKYYISSTYNINEDTKIAYTKIDRYGLYTAWCSITD
eukprot:11367970-Ditylum_brightwellii.AAC.1